MKKLRYQVRAFFGVLSVMVYLRVTNQVDHSEPPRASIFAATSAKSSVDFTYGTTLAGRNAIGAYGQLESILEQNFQPLVHREHSVAGIKVCIITNEYFGIGPLGGIGHVLYELTRLLSKHNAVVTVVYLGENKIDDEIVRDNAARGISLVRAPRPKILIEPNHNSLKDSYRALHFLMESEAKNELFDIVHFNDYLGHGLYPLYAKKQGWLLARSKVVITLYGTDGWTKMASEMTLPRNLNDLRLDWCEMQAIALADYVCASSKFIATYVLSRGIKIGGNLFHIGNAPPLVQSGKAANRNKMINKFSEIVLFGRFEFHPGLDLFIKGLDLFALGHPGVLETMKITFLGYMTSSSREILKKARSRSRNLGHIGFNFIPSLDLDEAVVYIQNPSRLIVIPSHTETETVLECIVMNVSFIASDAGGIPEMIHPRDRNATLFRPLPRYLARKLSERIMTNQSNFHYARHAELPAQIQSEILTFHNLVHTDLQRSVEPPNSVSHPKVTVCMTHYERPLVLMESLKHIQQQTFVNFDLTVVDGGSESTETLRVLEENVSPFMDSNGWKLVMANHGYHGEAYNYCARNTNNNADYILFIDEDIAVAPEALQVLVDTAQHTCADIVTSFLHIFEGDNKETGKSEKVLMFTGGSPTMGILSNVFGGFPFLVSRNAFFSLGGFTEFEEVGHEDYELYMKAAVNGFRVEVIPRDDLIFIKKKELLMSAKMDTPLAYFRSMSPLLNRYPRLQDVFMAVKGLN